VSDSDIVIMSPINEIGGA